MFSKTLNCWWLLLTIMLLNGVASAQAQAQTPPPYSPFSLSASIGYDYPLFNLPYNELKYRGGRYFDLKADYFFSRHFGGRVVYANLQTRPKSLLPDEVTGSSTKRSDHRSGKPYLSRPLLGWRSPDVALSFWGRARRCKGG